MTLSTLLLTLLNQAKRDPSYVPGLTSVGMRIVVSEGNPDEPDECVLNDVGEPVYPGIVLVMETHESPRKRYGIVVLDPKVIEFTGPDLIGRTIDAKSSAMMRLSPPIDS